MLKRVIQKDEKTIYIEKNTGDIHMHGPNGNEIVKSKDIERLRDEFGEWFQIILDAIAQAQQLNAIHHFLTPNPVNTDVFIGRKEELENIYKKLHNNNTFLLLVNGEGGIGKSTLAAEYYRKYEKHYQHCAWLVNEQGIANTLLQLAPVLGLQFEANATPDERWKLLLYELQKLPERCLLVLDNTNKPEDLEVLLLCSFL